MYENLLLCATRTSLRSSPDRHTGHILNLTKITTAPIVPRHKVALIRLNMDRGTILLLFIHQEFEWEET
jgi:hypothetical protein